MNAGVAMTETLESLRNKLREGYAAAVRSNSKEISNILFDCIGLVALLSAEEIPSSTTKQFNTAAGKKKHRWTESDLIVALYLAKNYDDMRFKSDPVALKLIASRPTISIGSLQMAIQNFYYLLGKKNGLSSVSKLERRVYQDFADKPLKELNERVLQQLL